MKKLNSVLIALGVLALVTSVAGAAAAKCPADSVKVGPVCIDKYEASVWDLSAAPANKKSSLIKKIQAGTATETSLLADGAIQRGVSSDDYPCNDNGNDCTNIYAVSIPGVIPSRFITWFQALAAARNAGKQLPTNQEWQSAALGTPDPGADNETTDCNTTSATFALPEDPVPAGSRLGCVSHVGAFDMVGNLWEWVADWAPRASVCGDWSVPFGNDQSCMNGAAGDNLPGALIRGGTFHLKAGVFEVSNLHTPALADGTVGFRAAR